MKTMDSQIEISDDDDSFNGPECSTNVQNNPKEDVIAISSDEEFNKFSFDNDFMSDDEDSSVVVEKKKAAVKSLFSSKNRKGKGNGKNKQRKAAVKALFPQKQNVSVPVVKSVKTRPPIEPPKDVFNKMIEGVNVMLPVNPYGSQIALMSKIITAIKKKENCILESPTGSGKTLALLCGALAWQQHEQKQLGQTQAQHYFTKYPEIKKDGVADYISSPIHQKTDATPEKLFSKNNFGEKSIYYKPEENGESSSTVTRQEKTPYRQISEEESPCNQVTIHKRPRLGSGEYEDTTKFSLPHTPEKTTTENNGKAETPESIRNLYDLVENLRVCTSMFVGSSLPTIYYGARTHTQIKQVVKEFKRTSYCGMVKMTLLSSRDKSCIKDFDRSVWSSRNDMCRACVKPIRRGSNKENSNCKFYDNRTALNHNCMPAAFDLEDLVEIGREKEACPYYGARAMAKTAHIVFCPYNYLIDPSIRSSLSIDLTGAVVIIDEAHNIEGICRDVASVDITQLQIQNAIKELETVSQYRFANQDVEYYIDGLLNTLNSWNYWFQNQIPLMNQQPVNNNEAIYKWQQTADFVNTLNNHNIGYVQYADFKRNAESFCRRLREDASTLYGVTQATGTLLEAMDMALGFLFRDHCQHMDDFKPALIKHVTGKTSAPSANTGWRSSQFNDWVSKEALTLSLICLNSGIVMQALQKARCIALASGTLTPLISLHSELETTFPHRVSPNHVIPGDRVWIGTLLGDATGDVCYNASGASSPRAQRALGAAILRVCRLTAHGVLCFLPSYSLLDRLIKEWQDKGLWYELNQLKNVFCERRSDRDHEETMNDFYQTVGTTKGALLFAVYRGKVSEGMDFKDQQARAVICVGVPYPNLYDTGVSAKMQYNDKYMTEKNLLTGKEWLRVQAYRALNQAVGRCVRHRGDWGAVLLVDSRYRQEYYTEHLSKWVKRFLGNNHHTYESLTSSPNGLAAFMQKMKIIEEEESLKT
ncbi:unnamed protein product [Spodoptera littoralis]|uniref:DNA 5'-3' helicase n=1 Tax=Spodoptera littoralis TaxID=7109 RepID=A0A9P0N486_SPOLI|nr:unnamed protein product [Spodoptera littoralis]CAH1640994.1 unnamed protein product [Spodoptera littoralis]